MQVKDAADAKEKKKIKVRLKKRKNPKPTKAKVFLNNLRKSPAVSAGLFFKFETTP
jgi:hypothetical protein